MSPSTVSVELELDAVKKLEAAKMNPRETLSDVVRRDEFPARPWLARDLLEDLGILTGTASPCRRS